MIRMKASNDLYPEFAFLLTVRAQWMNAHLFFDLRETPEAERLAFVTVLNKELERTFEELTH